MSLPGSQNGSHGPIDLFAARNGFTADFKGENGGATNDLNKLGESDDFDDTFGDFETAFVEQPSKKKVNMGFLLYCHR